MPFVVPFIPLIAAAATATVSGIEMSQRPDGSGAKKQLMEAQQKQAAADAQARQKAILASLPNAQEQGGGALNAPSLTDLAAVIAGLPGESGTTAGKGALASYLGTGTGTTGGQPQETMTSATNQVLNGSMG